MFVSVSHKHIKSFSGGTSHNLDIIIGIMNGGGQSVPLQAAMTTMGVIAPIGLCLIAAGVVIIMLDYNTQG